MMNITTRNLHLSLIWEPLWLIPVSYTHLDVYKRQDECFRLIAENELLAEDGVIVAEHRREEKMPEELHGFQKQKERRYGIVMLSIYANG